MDHEARKAVTAMDDLVMAAIRHRVLEVLPELDPQFVAEDRSLAELGANSIDRADVVTMVMDDLGVSVSVSEFHDIRDIGTLAHLLREHLR